MARNSAFAKVEDLEKIWHPLTDGEGEKATALLEQASNYLRQIARNNCKDLDDMVAGDPTSLFAETVKMVVVNSVQRAMATPEDLPPDATQWSQSASPYSESYNFSGTDRSASIYFKRKELDLLGIGKISGSGISVLRGAR